MALPYSRIGLARPQGAESGRSRPKIRPTKGFGGPYGTESQAQALASHTSTIPQNANRTIFLDPQGKSEIFP